MQAFKVAFNHFASFIAQWCGSPIAFCLALATVLIWAVTGPYFHYSESWQIVINTGTTIVTFLMVFIIQNSQNRDGLSLQLKLDELIRAIHGARNRFIALDEMDEDELVLVRESFRAANNKGGSALNAKVTAKISPASAVRSVPVQPRKVVRKSSAQPSRIREKS